MTVNDLVTKYGSKAKAARALGVSKGTLTYWAKVGIPPHRQAHIQVHKPRSGLKVGERSPS